MRRELWEALLVIATGTLVLVGFLWLMAIAPQPWKLVIWYAAFVATGVAIWIITGFPIAGVLAWMAPLLAVWTLAVMRPNAILMVALPLLATAPMLGFFVPRVGRLVHRYMSGAGRWILEHSIVGEDGRTWLALRRAIAGTARLRADARKIENARLVIGSQRRHAELILAVPAPDPEWAGAIRAAAAPRILYRQMLEGYRPLDYDLMQAEVARADDDLTSFIASRSALYRFLSLRSGDGRGRRPTERRRR